ncbi:MAG: alpha/beta hydrolase [Proteobacteria bacterium]|nr:alpha/beta hydrolase [Pseudomonadota bacterium]
MKFGTALSTWRGIGPLCVALVALTLAACSAPVTVERISLRTAYEDINRTALSSDELSEATRTVLRRAALLDLFDAAPDTAIADLRAQAIASGMHWPELFALAEMTYDQGRRKGSKPMLLASALYAYAVLFPAGDADKPSPYSAQFQHATSFYNLALTQVLSRDSGEGTATLEGGSFPLPFGTVDIAIDQASLTFAGRPLTTFVPTMNLEVGGFKNDYRSDGLGVPMAAGVGPAPRPDVGLVLPRNLRIPTSAVLTMDDPRRQLASTQLSARLRVYTIYDTASIRIDGQAVPLEYDQTAVRALFASENKGWSRELSGLLDNTLLTPSDSGANDQLAALEPHRRGRIPVVLVHGTASSPIRWGDMVNDLLEDKEIRDNYEFWFFTYNTGNPIPFSANVLRHSLEAAVQSLGGVQADPALDRMVVIGHSQGGLLTKMIAIDSGSRIWDALSQKPVDELPVKPETKALLKESLFIHPLPFIETVIFIATPHGGSFRANLTIAGLFARLVTLPLTIGAAAADVLTNAADALKVEKDRRAFNSLNGMAPGNPVIGAVRAIPVAPGIHAHSIIPTLQDGPLENRDDGVVEYKSAHLDGVDSELVIEHQGHSAQSNPLVVREVRRILNEELARPPRASAGATEAGHSVANDNARRIARSANGG